MKGAVMADDKSVKVEAFFDGYASQFDSLYGHSGRRGPLGRLLDATLRKTMFLRFREVLRHTASPEIRSVLDIGCGPGHYCLEFLKQGKTVVGLDLADGMLKMAAELAAPAGKASFVKADYLQHAFAEPFDAACLMGFFDYIADPVKVIEKLKKDVTKEFYASFPAKSGILALQRRIRYWVRNCPLYLYSRQDVDRIMKAAGVARYEVIDFGRDYFVKASLR